VGIWVVAFSFAVTFFHEAAARLFGICDTIIAIVLSLNIRKLRAQVAAVIWFGVLALHLVNEAVKTNYDESSWPGRWAAILER
jgi:hypothetical protein